MLLARRSFGLHVTRALRRLSTSSRGLENVFHPQEILPWSSSPHTRERSGPELATHNHELSRLARGGKIVGTIERARKMKESGVIPNVETYNYIIMACATAGLPNEARAFFDEMLLANLKPNIETFFQLIKAERFSDTRVLYAILDTMEKHDVKPNEYIYHQLVSRHALEGQLEECLRILSIMARDRIIPELVTVHRVITLATSTGFPRLAIDLAFAFEHQGVRRLESETWMECLRGSAESLYADGVALTWNQVVLQRGIVPDEGLCISVLHTASRHGLATLAVDVIRVLKKLDPNIRLSGYHLEPVLESQCRAGQIDKALETIQQMRASGIQIDRPTLSALTTAISSSTANLDTVWSLLEEHHRAAKAIDVSIFNCMIEAAVLLKDFPRALGILRSASDFDVSPALETFHILLSAAVDMGDQKFGDDLLGKMEAERLQPDKTAYELFIMLNLTQEHYENAFVFLERMKERGMTPAPSVYRILIQKCVKNNDSRHEALRKELRNITIPEKGHQS